MSAKHKISLAITGCWLIFFMFIMYTQVVDDSLPAKYLFRTFLLTVTVPLFFLWITDTLKYILAWFKE